MTAIRPFLYTALFCACTACGQAPNVGAALSEAERAAPFPTLLPLNTVLAGQSTQTRLSDLTQADLAVRIARLRARAAALSGPVVDSATRAEMRAGVARAALR